MIRDERIIGNCRLILGDCLEVLPTLEGVDAVVTDPPYLIRDRFGEVMYKGESRRLQFHFDAECDPDNVANAVVEACGKAAAFFLFCGVRQISPLDERLSEQFTVKPAVWIKKNPPPPMPGNWWPSGFEHALYGYRPGAWFGDERAKRVNVFYSDTYRHGIRADEKVDHPTQKWLPLIEHIVESVVRPGGVCLDPFMGSGTTGVACARRGRRFIGIEIEPRYYEIACRRIEEAYRQADLFIDQPKVKAEQVSMFEEAK